MGYVVLVGGLVSLVSVAVACYLYERARADRADRDAALGRAASATDLASRLQTSLDALRADQDKVVADAKARAGTVHDAPGAANFLRDATGVLPGDPSGPAQGGLPTPTGPRARAFVSGFGR